MKKLFVLAPLLLLGGCGLKMVNKQDLISKIEIAKVKVLEARAEACSQEYVDKVEGSASLLQALINQFE